MQKILFLIAMISSLFIFTSTSFAAEPVSIIVKNKKIQTDTPPLFEKGRVLIPIRAVAESLDASVQWESKTKTATVSKWSKKIDLTVGKKTVRLQSSHNKTTEVSIDVPVKNVNNRVYIPLRVVSESLGYEVHWANSTVSINAPKSKWGNYFNGTLSEARKIAMSIPSSSDLQYEHEPLDVNSGFVRATYLFPEGEALQFYSIDGDIISYIQFKDDFPVVVWQAQFQGIPVQAFVERNFTKQRGTPPATNNKPHLYYDRVMFGVSNTWESGRIDIDGTITETGYLRKVEGMVTDERGTLSLTMTDEQRVDYRDK